MSQEEVGCVCYSHIFALSGANTSRDGYKEQLVKHCLGSGCDSIFAVRGRDMSIPVSATGATGFSVFLSEQCELHPNVLHKPLVF